MKRSSQSLVGSTGRPPGINVWRSTHLNLLHTFRDSGDCTEELSASNHRISVCLRTVLCSLFDSCIRTVQLFRALGLADPQPLQTRMTGQHCLRCREQVA